MQQRRREAQRWVSYSALKAFLYNVILLLFGRWRQLTERIISSNSDTLHVSINKLKIVIVLVSELDIVRSAGVSDNAAEILRQPQPTK